MSTLEQEIVLNADPTAAQRLADVLERLDATLKTVQSSAVSLTASLDISGPVGRSIRSLQDFEGMLERTGRAYHLFNQSTGNWSRFTNPFEQMLRDNPARGFSALQVNSEFDEMMKKFHYSSNGISQGNIGQMHGPLYDPTRVGNSEFDEMMKKFHYSSNGISQGNIKTYGPLYDPTRAGMGPLTASQFAPPSYDGGGGFLGGVGSGIFKAAATLYTIERLVRGVARLAEVVEKSIEQRERQNEAFRELGVAEPNLDLERGRVEQRARALNVPASEFLEVFQKTIGIKGMKGEPLEGLLNARADIEAGAFAIAGGNKDRAGRILTELGRASQAMFLPAHERAATFRNMRSFGPGGVESFLEGHGYSQAQATKLVNPGGDAQAFQRTLVLLEELMVTAGHTRLPDNLPKEVNAVGDAFNKLIANNGFPMLTESLVTLAGLTENSEAFAMTLRVLDAALELVVSTITLALRILEVAVRPFRGLELAFGATPTEHEKKFVLSGDPGKLFQWFTTTDEESTDDVAKRHVIKSKARSTASGGSHPAQGGYDSSGAYHSSASIGDVHIENHIYPHAGQNPEEIGRHVAQQTPVQLSAFMEQLKIMKSGAA